MSTLAREVVESNLDSNIQTVLKEGKKTVVRKDIQAKVDRYLELHKYQKELESRMKALREDIEPYMESKGLNLIEGAGGGSIQIVTQNRAEVTARYTSYEVEEVEPLLTDGVADECIKAVIDRDVLELMVKTGKAPKSVLELKKTKEVPMFTARKY